MRHPLLINTLATQGSTQKNSPTQTFHLSYISLSSILATFHQPLSKKTTFSNLHITLLCPSSLSTSPRESSTVRQPLSSSFDLKIQLFLPALAYHPRYRLGEKY